MSDGGTVGKAMAVLDQVAEFGRPVRFAELQTGSPLPKATLYRLVQTLTQQGLLQFDPDRSTYALGVRLVCLAHAAWQQSALAPLARPHLDRLSTEIAETVHLAQLDRAQVLYVDKRNAAQPVEMFSDAGKIGPAYCTGVGKAMLAFLEDENLSDALKQQSYHRFTEHTYTTEAELRAELTQIGARGYAFDREEHEPDIICVAVPILSATQRMLGALSVTGQTSRTSLGKLEMLAPQLQATASAIAEDAATWRFPDETKTQRTGT
ncbi:MAG: IclR family transcriptional regulator [Aliishimia sp.]